jgi:hypothetical protein
MDLENFAFSSFSPNGFNSYDPEDSYDPESSYDASMDYADRGSRAARRASRTGFSNVGTAQLDLVITTNSTTEAMRLELFNAQRSIGYTNNSSLFISPAKTVSSAYEADLAEQNATSPYSTTRAGHIYWCSGLETPTSDGVSTAGALRIYEGAGTSGAAAATKFVQIQCRQIPYKTLLEATKVSPFLVNKTRISVTGSSALPASTLNSQFDFDYTHITNTFLGAVRSNPISPRSYFNPQQFQQNVVDLPVSYLIDGEKGINYQILSASGGSFLTATVTLFISKYDKVTNAKNAL